MTEAEELEQWEIRCFQAMQHVDFVKAFYPEDRADIAKDAAFEFLAMMDTIGFRTPEQIENLLRGHYGLLTADGEIYERQEKGV